MPTGHGVCWTPWGVTKKAARVLENNLNEIERHTHKKSTLNAAKRSMTLMSSIHGTGTF